MSLQRMISTAARGAVPYGDVPPTKLHADTVVIRPATTILDITIDSGPAAEDELVAPTPRRYSLAALEHAVWMVPDGDGWAEVYSDGDGWAVWDVEIWSPAVSYGDRWAVPDGDGWSAYEPHES